MKFTKPFIGVPDGHIYPVAYAEGDDCPPELEAAAKDSDAIAAGDAARKPKPKG